MIEQMHDRSSQAVHGIKRQPERDIAHLPDAGIGKHALQIVLEDSREIRHEHGQQRQQQHDFRERKFVEQEVIPEDR